MQKIRCKWAPTHISVFDMFIRSVARDTDTGGETSKYKTTHTLNNIILLYQKYIYYDSPCFQHLLIEELQLKIFVRKVE